MSKKISSLHAEIGADTSGIESGLRTTKDGLKQAESQTKAFQAMSINAWLDIGKTVMRAAQQVYAFAESGAQLARMEQAGTALAATYGQNMDDIVRSTQRATGGAVSEFDLIAAANKSMMLGVATDADQMGEIFTVAAARARVMGISTTQAVNDITTGIGRMSPQILDNLGIITGGQKVFADYAKSIGISVDELSDMEKKQILVNKVIESSTDLLDDNGELVDDVASAYERLGASTADAGNRLKQEFGEAMYPVVNALADMFELSNQVNSAMEALGLSAGKYGTYIDETGQVVANTTEELLAMAEAQELLNLKAGLGASPINSAADAVEGLGEAADETAASVVGLFDEIDTSIGSKVAGWMEQLSLSLAGIMPLQDLAADVRQAIEEGTVTPEQGREMLSGIFTAIKGVEVEANQISLIEAGKAVSEQLGIPLQEALAILRKIKDEGSFNITSRITVKIRTEKFVDWHDTRGYAAGGVLPRADGGDIGPVTLVGEQGPELIINGVVVPADVTRKLMGLGLRPTQAAAMGLSLDPGDVHVPSQQTSDKGGETSYPKTPVFKTDKPGSKSSKGGETQTTKTTSLDLITEITQSTASATAAQAAANTTQAAQQAALTVIAPAINQQSVQLRQQQERALQDSLRQTALLEEIRDGIDRLDVALGESVADALSAAGVT